MMVLHFWKKEVPFYGQYLLSVNELEEVNSKVVNILDEEISAYYSGQKTAEEVADIVQSRISIYLSEQM